MVSVRESSVERRLDVLARRHGGLTVKLAAGGAGMPDRLVVLPGGRVWFGEASRRPGARVAGGDAGTVTLVGCPRVGRR